MYLVTFNEILLLIGIIAAVILPKIISVKLNTRYKNNIKLIGAILLLLLVWTAVPIANDNLPYQVLISIAVLYNGVKNFTGTRRVRMDS